MIHLKRECRFNKSYVRVFISYPEFYIILSNFFYKYVHFSKNANQCIHDFIN